MTPMSSDNEVSNPELVRKLINDRMKEIKKKIIKRDSKSGNISPKPDS